MLFRSPKRTEETKGRKENFPVKPDLGPVLAGWGSGCVGLPAGLWPGLGRSGCRLCSDSKIREFWAEKRHEKPRFHGKLAKLSLENANKDGGGPKATDPWIKTSKNSSNRPNRSNPKMAIFGGNFRISQKRRKIWWILVDHMMRVGPDFHGFVRRGRRTRRITDEHEEHTKGVSHKIRLNSK